jgi:methylglutamate dehydrogenase subunit B
MRIACPFCGERGNEEFSYLGDAAPERPVDGSPAPLDSAGMSRWTDYVYLRDNPAGIHRELWQHVGGCRSWLVVTRNTLNHAISKVEIARDVALARDGRSA